MIQVQTELILEDCKLVTSCLISRLEPLKNGTILITGGTGFIGTWLAEIISFLNDYYDFKIHLYLLSTHANTFKERRPHLASRQDISLIERDIRNLTDIPQDVSWIIHAAANPDSRAHASEPLKTVEVIVNGTDSILEYATRLPELNRILNISSGNIYGFQPLELDKISEKFIGGLDCSAFNAAYPESKRIAETICSIYRNQHRLPIVNARPFAFIGPYQGLDRPWAVNNFIRDAILGGPIRILGDGQTVRSYMYPSDLVWWLLNILVHGKVGANYNVGSPEAITILDLAEKIAAQFPKSPKIISGLSKDNSLRISKFVPDVNFVIDSLDLKITTNLDTAIKRTILWNQNTIIKSI